MNSSHQLAPELIADRWFNVPSPVTLESLRGRPVLLHSFQMLCPGCVAHALPQAEKIHRMFGKAGLAVIGLHTVFEHHAAMTPVALEAFIHEYRLTFPIGVDRPAPAGPVPLTMQAYAFRGTPSAVLIDRDGRIRLHAFGQLDDLALGAAIGALSSINVLPQQSR
jgi:peroxiredoxin